MPMPNNKRILRSLIQRERHIDSEDRKESLSYLIIYAFLYKYLSDNLESYLADLVGGEKHDLKLLYDQEDFYEMFKKEALDNLGYFFKTQSSFMSEVLNQEYTGNYFSTMFYNSLKDNIEFKKDSSYEHYFKEIFNIMENEINFDDLDFDNRSDLIIRDYIMFISNFTIDEENFTFQQVYDVMSSSRILAISQTQEYISNILNYLVLSQKNNVYSVYDPFLKDASAIVNVSKYCKEAEIYGKEENLKNYFYSLVKIIIDGVDVSKVSFFNENSMNSMEISNNEFDVILSKIPNVSRSSRALKKKNVTKQVFEQKVDLKKEILSKLDYAGDEEVMDALDLFLNKVESAKTSSYGFKEEYESLNDSEFLFIIDMLNSLNERGIMAISISQNFLFKKSLRTLRKYLTFEKNYIDAIISLPEELGRTIRPEVIILFKKDKIDEDILFIDISKKYETTKSPNAVPGLFRRNLVLTDQCLEKVVEIYSKRQIIDKISNRITLNDLNKNDFNLAVSRYVDTYDGEFVKLSDLASQKEKIDKRMDELNKKIEEMMINLEIKF